MATSTEAETKLCEVMLAAYGAGDDFEFELGRLCAGYREKHERTMRDMEASRLLPLGWAVVAERFGVCKATVYNMEQRARKSKQAAHG